MKKISRRKFIKDSAKLGVGLSFLPGVVSAAPMVLTNPRVSGSTDKGVLNFTPHFVQRGTGPHLLDWAYASDENWDTFHSNISATNKGVSISDTEGQERFGIDVRWNVEDMGYIFLTADNGGEYYSLPEKGKTLDLNLNYELAKSRVIRNRKRVEKYRRDKTWAPAREVSAFLAISDEYYSDASKIKHNSEKCAEYSQQAIKYAMKGGELLEIDRARHLIRKTGARKDFYFGCDVRHYYQMDKEVFMDTFTDLFNYGMLTYVVNGDRFMGEFEPEEGELNFLLRDVLQKELIRNGITVQGRALFWFHKWVTPEWLRTKNFDSLKKYVEQHTRDVISHYGDSMYGWEIMNEIHDWANEVNLDPDQLIEITKFACDVAKDTAPRVKRIINHCCPFAEYVQLGEWSGQKACCPQRTPVKFTHAMVDAGVDFDIIGQQMYFPYRDLQDSIMMIERYEQFNKPVQLSEVGCPGGPTLDSINTDKYKITTEPHIWRRPWDDELQADWLEGIYTLGYSKSYIESISWFDIINTESYIQNGGLLLDDEGGKKPAYHRLKNLQTEWNSHNDGRKS